MNNFYTLLHLCGEFNRKCEGMKFISSYSPFRSVWEMAMQRVDGDGMRLVFSAHPSETAIFTRKERPHRQKNVTFFFEDLEGRQIRSFEMVGQDRFIRCRFDGDDHLLFQVFGNHPNVFLVRDGIIVESFKGGESHVGERAPEPRTATTREGMATASLGTTASVGTTASLGTTALPVDPASVKKQIIHFAPSFPREHIPELIRQHHLTTLTSESIHKLVSRWIEQLSHQPEFRVLSNGHLCLLSSENLHDTNDVQETEESWKNNETGETGETSALPAGQKPVQKVFSFDTCDEAVRFCYDRMSGRRRLEKRKMSLLERIEPAIHKVELKMAHIKDPEKTLERAQRYEQCGHLLMANAHRHVEHGSESITVQDFYDGGAAVDIPIKPNRSIAENAELYYGKAAASRKRLERMKLEKHVLLERLEILTGLHKTLPDIQSSSQLERWLKQNRDSMARALPGQKTGSGSEVSKPWRVWDLDGYEVWIGKNAKSNDLLTSAADKEDIWMHARGVSGSHLVIRMNRSKALPPETVLQRAAALAAWYSKARGSSLVPVIFTRRKYVVKQKGGAPGAVRILRESVLLVEPQKPLGHLDVG